jgi:PAS domain S-box-containing protein
MHFGEAIFQRSRIDMLEAGSSFLTDHCFHGFIRRWPRYLKSHIVDVKGRLPREGRPGETSASSCSSSDETTSVLDQAVEESIGQVIIGQSRLRLAVEHAFEDRHPDRYSCLVYAALLILVVTFSGCLVLVEYFADYFEALSNFSSLLLNLNTARTYFTMSGICWIYYWGTEMNAVNYDIMIKPIREKEPRVPDAFIPEPNLGWDHLAMHFAHLGRIAYQQLMTNIVELGDEGYNLDLYAGEFFHPGAIKIQYCSANGDPSSVYSSDARTGWIYLFMMETIFMSQPNLTLWFSNAESPCVLFRTMPSLPHAFSEIGPSLSQIGTLLTDNGDDLFAKLRLILPLALMAFYVLIWTPATVLYLREIQYFTSLLLALPKNVKRECARPIRRDLEDSEAAAGQPSGGQRSTNARPALVFNVVVFFLLAGICAVVGVQMENCHSTNNTFSFLVNWVIDASTRKATALDSILAGVMTVLELNELTFNPTGENYFTSDGAKTLAQSSSDSLTASNVNLLDIGETPSSIGWNDDIDALTIRPQCEETNAGGFHELYRCTSAVQLTSFLKNTVSDASMNASSYHGFIGANDIGELLHLVDQHLLPKFITVDSLYHSLGTQETSKYGKTHYVYFASEVVLLAILAAVTWWYCHTMNALYDIVLALMRRVPPAAILASAPLEEYLLGRTSAKRRIGMTSDERIVHTSLDSIILTNAAGMIEAVNPAVTATLGFTPEQVVGQPISLLIESSQAEKVEQQMKLMIEHQSGRTSEGHTVCVADDETQTPCWISLLALSNGDEVSSFVVILRDETDLLAQQEEAEAAKKQSETLLYQILPRDIVARLNAGEKDISFSIESATIMFIDIVKFSDYAANLTPQDIMGNLSQLFTGFDEACARFPLLIKIKLIGDVYMCAGGLFSLDIPPQGHAEQMVRFALDALQAVDDVNLKLSAALAVRIGINTGGPILAGVLGTDRPAFDIIGDPINVAARLQSTDIPGKIQISEGTQELLIGLDFPIEYRGEVELKGKGKKKTFLIDPQQRGVQGLQLLHSTIDEIARFMPCAT